MKMITHQLYIHKKENIMCEYYFKRNKNVKKMERNVKFSLLHRDGMLFIGKPHGFFGCHFVWDLGLKNRCVFPDDFELIGDI